MNIHAFDINSISEETKKLVDEANQVFIENQGNEVWFGRCIFLSWYCSLGDCTFCYRSTQKHKIQHPREARRTKASILTEVFLIKHLGWRLEFLTGGYGVYRMPELIDIAKNTSKIYGSKIWLNIGALGTDNLDAFQPYVKGVCASLETLNPDLHKKVAPSKSIEPFEKMFINASEKNYRKSMCIIIGLGETKEDIKYLHEFISKYNLDRMTFYALNPIKGTPFSEGPDPEYYAWWIAKTRIAFPKMQIIAGTGYSRVREVELLVRAGANAITKFPATRFFASKEAQMLEEGINKTGRRFTSTLTKVPDLDWDKEVDDCDLDPELAAKIKIKLKSYLDMLRGKRDKIIIPV